MSEDPVVTVLIPARNEARDIERCLRAVLAQDYPHDRMEIVLVDGGSTDRTSMVAEEVLGRGDIVWKIIDNPRGNTPSNLNTGLDVASGEYLCRVDARSIIPVGYVRSCVRLLAQRSDLMVIGGAQVAIPRDRTAIGVGIARALNNRYAMGGARYRIGATSGPSDTVYLGAFRTEQLRSTRGWDERLLTNQDFELNRRLGVDGVVWFEAGLSVGYLPRRSIAELWGQYHRFGRWKVRYWRLTGDSPLPRQMLLVIGAPVTAAGAVAVVRCARSWRLRLACVLALGAAAVAIEDRGSAGPHAGLQERVVAVTAMSVVSAAWVAGVWRELVAPRR